jgi:hypothetical protein
MQQDAVEAKSVKAGTSRERVRPLFGFSQQRINREEGTAEAG